MDMKLFVILGAVNAFISVALGAFGAHGLEGRISDHYLGIWETAVQYQMFHAAGLIAIGILVGLTGVPMNAAGWLMFAGIIFFSGSLYVLAVSGISVLGAVTPIGGVLFLAAWVMVIIGMAGI
ncbi:DUF423 domain-containing protein [Lacicoccus alkaliphilus]|uniref:Uncharacterized membrane protein YgdD, TMEM256/DUF423 family n=2 Tax=Lacicoccus TaxID=3076172 RepID=A0A1M7HZI9_9BACL|nr:Uncharacterized membrane protein YgdD, TMEM256/DUF423 family [Salinicoccus alkaliphilus DSM 16010]